MFVKLHTNFEDCTTLCSNLQRGKKKEFSIPHEFDVKAINLDQNNKLGLFHASFSIEILTQIVDYID